MRAPYVYAAVLAASLAVTSELRAESITAVGWGGIYTQSQKKAFFDPFQQATGIEVKTDDWNGDLGKLRAMQQAGQVTWDIVVGDEYIARAACDEGLLETIDNLALPAAPDGKSAADDFVPGAVLQCGVGTMIFGIQIGYDASRISGDGPTGAIDFFDLKKFPGKRGLYKDPTSMIFALMADGVPYDKIFATLGTPDGVDRALKKLDTIKASTIWWTTFAQPAQLLNDREVVMTTAGGPRLIQPIVKDKKPWRILRSDFYWAMDFWMIPKNAPNAEQAKRFIEFASDSGRIAEIAKIAAYNSVRYSSMDMLANAQGEAAEMRPYLFLDKKSLAGGLAFDSVFWADHVDELTTRFNTWLAQ